MDVTPLILGIVGGSAGTAIINHFLNKDERKDKQTDNIIGRLTKEVDRLAKELEKRERDALDCEEAKQQVTVSMKKFESDMQKFRNKLIQANLYDDM